MIKSIARAIIKMIPANKILFLLFKKMSVPNIMSQYLNFKGVLYKVPVGQTQVNFFSNGLVQDNRLFWRGLEVGENVSIKLWQYLCKSNHVIIDVGSNIGLFAIVAKALNPQAEVHAFEPIPETFQMLKKNVDVNDFDIKLHEYALSDKNGNAEIYMDGENNLTPSLKKGTSGNSIKIQMLSLDSITNEHNIAKTDLLKIDVETFEPEVLEGMKEIIKRNRPTMIIEVLNDEVGARSQKILEGNDYIFFYIDELSGLIPSDKLIRLKRSRNYLICQPHFAEDILKQPFAKLN